MNDTPIIQISAVSKVYKLYKRPLDRLLDSIFPAWGKRRDDFWALKDISLSINRGESVGIIGVNGSGKSTLLQIICAILPPSQGAAAVNGRITALLELGAGFSPESTGRENVYLQGAIMGQSRAQIDLLFPAIERFADIGGFIDKPVKTYSSGMLVRLAISVAFEMKPAILIVDEALAVGDIFFQSKCINKLHQMRADGVTLLFVSHAMGTVRALCDRVILLDQGRVICAGDPSSTIEAYYALRAEQLGAVELENFHPPADNQPLPEPEDAPALDIEVPETDPQPAAEQHHVSPTRGQRYGNAKGWLCDYSINDQDKPQEIVVPSGGTFDVSVEFSIDKPIENPFVAIMIRTWDGTEIYGNNTTYANVPIGPVKAGTTIKTDFAQQLHLNNGQYLLTLALAEWGESDDVIYVDRHLNAVMIMVESGPQPYAGFCNMQGSVVSTCSED